YGLCDITLDVVCHTPLYKTLLLLSHFFNFLNYISNVKVSIKFVCLVFVTEMMFSCRMCALVFSNCFNLQEHVELHLQEQHSAEAHSNQYSAMCSQIFMVTQTSSTNVKPEHVDLHLNQGATVTCGGSLGSDLRLARKLQQEEEQMWSHDKAQQEKEEFKKLQRQFGVNRRGGYRRQMERTMDRFHFKRAEMMESLTSGVDDGKTKTPGMFICALYKKVCVHVWCADTDHYCSSEGDKGWGCGYRNLQMLIFSLYRIDLYSSFLQGHGGSRHIVYYLHTDMLSVKVLISLTLDTTQTLCHELSKVRSKLHPQQNTGVKKKKKSHLLQ
uniref:C2H2-type domain-containing protein n=1 Tax=Mastacembelus armatus TaxID=205130 RepID=A0A7N8WX14_9TELE